MNTRTFLSNFPTFVKRWTSYRKKLGPTGLGWTVMSDYCLDGDSKNDCITFTISPNFGQPNQMAEFLNRNLPHDIKNVTHISQDVINFIRDCHLFFNLVFVFPQKQELVDMQYFKTDMVALSESSMITEENRKRIREFSQKLNRKGGHKKVLQNLSLVTFLFGKIVEFLTIKHFAEGINWFPDRDPVMDIGKGIIKELSNVGYTNAIAGRVKTPIIHMGMENPVTKEFVFDPLVRYPDIITGVFSSISIYEQRTPKEKHIRLWNEALLNNPRTVLFTMLPNEIRCTSLRLASTHIKARQSL